MPHWLYETALYGTATKVRVSQLQPAETQPCSDVSRQTFHKRLHLLNHQREPEHLTFKDYERFNHDRSIK